jgi:hypothetical protein
VKYSVDAKKVVAETRKNTVGGGTVAVKTYLIAGKQYPFAVVVQDYPAKRAYLGSHEYPSVKCTVSTASKFVTEMASVITGLSDKAFSAMESVFMKFIESGLAVTDDQAILEDLAIGRFTDGPDKIQSVADAAVALEKIGVKATTFIDFSSIAQVELEVAEKLALLKSSLDAAVGNAASPDAEKAKLTAQSDNALGKARCG